MKHLLLTGGLGFIGGTFVEMFHRDFKITIIDKVTYASRPERVQGLKNVEVFKVDLANYNDVLDVFKQIEPVDILLHMASESHVDNSIEAPGVFIQSNVVGTFNLLEIAKDFGVPKIYHVSTDEVIEHSKPLYDGKSFDRKREDNFQFKPSSIYSATKASQEMLVESYRKTHGCQIVIMRLCNQFGPYQHGEKLIPKTIKRALNNEKIPVFKTPAYRDWMYVQDGCKAIRKVLDIKKPDNLYHISTYQETLTLDIVKKVLQVMGKSDTLIEMVNDRKGYDLVYSMSSQKLREQTTWKPETTLIEGIVETVKHYEEELCQRNS